MYYTFQYSAKLQNYILLLFSFFFYGYAEWKMLVLLFASASLTWFIGLLIKKSLERDNSKIADGIMFFGILFGIGLLFYFKYFLFFLSSLHSVITHLGFNATESTLSIVMPLGISFFTFRMVSYIIDIRQHKHNGGTYLDTLLYVSYFPCILSGPIDLSSSFLPQLNHCRHFSYNTAVEGCQQILWGMFKKMVIADGLSLFITRDIHTSTGSTLLLVAIMYSIQIYADFSGYSDMAIGVSKLLGIRISRNFHYPYFSRSIAEFWNRWHMSLLTWFRYYIYIPLGGSRCSKIKVIRNTFAVFLVSGLWHGANWTFVIWGLFHALLFVPTLIKKPAYNATESMKCHKTKRKTDLPYSLSDIPRVLSVFILITIGWVIFRCNTIEESVLYFSKICSPSLFTMPAGVMWGLPAMMFALFMFVLEWHQRNKEFPLVGISKYRSVRWALYVFLILAIVFYQGKPVEFIYFKF